MRKMLLGLMLLTLSVLSCGRYAECYNPVIFSDIIDNQVVGTGDSFYMFSSSDISSCGIPYLGSKDLVHWDVSGNIMTQVSPLGLKCISARVVGNNVYVLYYSRETEKNVLFVSENIESGDWRSVELESRIIDGCLFYEGGKWFCLYVQDGKLVLTDFDENYSIDESRAKVINCPDSVCGILSSPEFYHIGNWYYLLVSEKNSDGFQRQLCLRSRTMDGLYAARTVLDGDFHNLQRGIAGACLVQTDNGEWYAMLSRRYAAFTQAPILQPIKWQDEWPVMGDDTRPIRQFKVHLTPNISEGLFSNDYFASSALDKNWQVKVGRDSLASWSLTEHKGFLRVYSNRKSDNIFDSEALFFRHVSGPLERVSVNLVSDFMRPGQCAGAAAIWGNKSLMVAVRMKEDWSRHFVYQEFVDGKLNSIFEDNVPIKFSTVTVGMNFYSAYNSVRGCYCFNEDGRMLICYYMPEINSDENSLSGVEFALFNYTTSETGGYVDFDNVTFTPLDQVD